MGYRIASLSQSFSKSVSAATTYAIGGLIANSSLAASVTPLSYTVGANFKLNSVSVTGTSTVNAQATFKVHLYGSSPTVTNGDGAAFLTTTSNYIDAVKVDCSVAAVATAGWSNGFAGTGAYTNSNNLASSAPGSLVIPYNTVYVLVSAAASWIGSSTAALTVTLNGEVNW